MKYSPDTPQDAAKYAVGRAAVERYAHDGARLGLGSGTTSAWMVRALGEKVAEGLQVIGVPTSNSTRDLALSLDIPLVDINDLDRPLDVTLDGPDEIDHDGDMIKGGGACLLVDVGHGDAGALGREAQRRGAADAGGAAGDQGDLVGQSHITP